MPQFSKWSVWVVALLFFFMRISYWDKPNITSVLTWDAFGYYLYLPGQYIYGDITKLAWLPNILEQYHPTGHLYQTILLPNGNFAMKYLIGLSILYTPFFFIGHWAAGWLGYAQDGFSAPYQMAICFGAWVYALVGLLVLRRVLLRFFEDQTVGITVLLIGLATNYPQYVVADTAMTHGFLFTVYAIALWAIVRWQEQLTARFAFLIGLCIGLAGITRPTEGVMLFLPTLWLIHFNKETPSKWAFFKQNPAQLWAALAGGCLGILPQIIYWKYVTGKWVFDVGSKFLFFRPHWQVLFGWEKGWFIYTPVTMLMIAGLFFMRNFPFKKAVLVFTILNIWIVIAWSDWRYGATYSCRALVQSYPVLALPLAIMVQKMLQSRWKAVCLVFFSALIGVNLFQIWQYNRTILHYDHMNRAYYAAIFLNPNPTPLQMSLLDTQEMIRDSDHFSELSVLVKVDSTIQINKNTTAKVLFVDTDLAGIAGFDAKKEQWLRLSAQVQSSDGAYDSNLTTTLTEGERVKRTSCRLENGICKPGEWNTIAYDFKLTADFANSRLRVEAATGQGNPIRLKNIAIRLVERK